MDLLEFNKYTVENFGIEYDIDSKEAILEFKRDFFSNSTLEEFLDFYRFKKYLITDIPKEFGMTAGELQEFATILYLDDMYALVNVDH